MSATKRQPLGYTATFTTPNKDISTTPMRKSITVTSDRKRHACLDVCEMLKIIANVTCASRILSKSTNINVLRESMDDRDVDEGVCSLINSLEDHIERLGEAQRGSRASGLESEIKEALDGVISVQECLIKFMDNKENCITSFEEKESSITEKLGKSMDDWKSRTAGNLRKRIDWKKSQLLTISSNGSSPRNQPGKEDPLSKLEKEVHVSFC